MKDFTNGSGRTVFFPVLSTVFYSLPVWQGKFIAINKVSLFFSLRSFLFYETSALNTKYLGMKITWSFWFKMAIWKEPELAFFHRNPESTAIYGTISSRKKP